MRKLVIGLVLVLVSSCYMGMTNNERERIDRIHQSEQMFKKMQKVRRRCTPKRIRRVIDHRIKKIKMRSVYYM
jgi:hypothetical protein